jgi:DNA-binding transcriptional regulator YdaS (Cro superfamily)
MTEPSDKTLEANPGVRMLCERIRTICNMHGGINKTAELLGVKHPRLTAWASGKNEPPAMYLAKIARLGNVTTDWLLADSRDGAQEMAWGEIRKGLDAMLRMGAVYAAAERKYHE